MAIIHEAYLFKPDEFAHTMLPFVRELQRGVQGQRLLHEAVLERLEQSSSARALAMEYGGWDMRTLYDDAALTKPDSPEQVARWIRWLLYDHLSPVPRELGLIGRWRVMKDILGGLRWHVSDRSLPIDGHSFGYFAQVWIVSRIGAESYKNGELEYWEHIWPGSTASHIGWLDHSDVQRLLYKLETDQTRLAEVTLQSPSVKATSANDTLIRQTYQLALNMLRSASVERSGLCLISGG